MPREMLTNKILFETRKLKGSQFGKIIKKKLEEYKFPYYFFLSRNNLFSKRFIIFEETIAMVGALEPLGFALILYSFETERILRIMSPSKEREITNFVVNNMLNAKKREVIRNAIETLQKNWQDKYFDDCQECSKGMFKCRFCKKGKRCSSCKYCVKCCRIINQADRDALFEAISDATKRRENRERALVVALLGKHRLGILGGLPREILRYLLESFF